jgi:hypothetical protein
MNEKCQNTETANKLINQYIDSYHQLEEQNKFLKKEIEIYNKIFN